MSATSSNASPGNSNEGGSTSWRVRNEVGGAVRPAGAPTRCDGFRTKRACGAHAPSTPATYSVSDRLAGFPLWVVDYVLVHELAHLAVPRHSKPFWTLVNRYPKAERARGFLIAKGLDADS